MPPKPKRMRRMRSSRGVRPDSASARCCPSALASALITISAEIDRIPQRDLRAASGEMAAFYIIAPRARQTVAGLFATHPPLEARLEALERLESQLQAAY